MGPWVDVTPELGLEKIIALCWALGRALARRNMV